MRARYIIILCAISLIINVISIYNFFLGMASLLLLLITLIPTLYVKLTSSASKVKESERTFATRQMAGYGSQKTSNLMNRIAIIVGLIVVYGMTVATLFLREKNWEHTSQLITSKVNFGQLIGVAQTLSKIGWGLFILALLIVTIYVIRLMKRAAFFKI